MAAFMISEKYAGLKYQSIIQALEQDILGGKYLFGQRIPTQNDLTDHFGVSRPTIEKALEHLEDKGLIQRRKGSGTFVSIDVNKERTKLKFAIIAPRPSQDYDFESNFVQLIISNFSAQAGKRDFNLLIDTAIADNQRELLSHSLKAAAELTEAGINGVFILPVDFTGEDTAVNSALVQSFTNAGVQVVLLDRDICQMPHRSRYDVVGINNRRAGFVVTDHLISNGAKNLLFVSCPLVSNTVKERIEGFKMALEHHDMNFDNRIIYDYDSQNAVCRRGVIKAIKASQGPTGIVCLNDQTAGVVMNEVVKSGFNVPAEVRIAGFDDLPMSSLLLCPLTTIRQPVAAMVQTAIDIMCNRLKDPDMPARDIFVAEQLVVRLSCGSRLSEGK